MKPAPFTYHRPEAVREAVGLLAEHGYDAKPLAGGQSLVPMLALRLSRFDHLVDLDAVEELRGVSEQDGKVRVGAMTRQSTLERDPVVAASAPLLARATPLVGHFQIRNRGTLGGSLAHADPAAEYPAVAVALDAELEIAGPDGPRTVPASEFFVSMWMTALEPDQLLTSVSLPTWGPRSGFAIEEVARRFGDFALVGAVCGVQVGSSGRVTRATAALFGVGRTPYRVGEPLRALVGQHPGEVELGDVARAACADLEPTSDVHAPSDYRRRVAAVVLERALRRAIHEAEDA